MNLDKDFYLDRFRFAAQKVDYWIRAFGKETAEKMVKESFADPDSWSEYTRESFYTAFGK